MCVNATMDPRVSKLLVQEQYAQRTPEWYARRENLLTASDVAAALNIPPYDSYRGSPRAELLKKKVNPVPFSNAFTAHGNKYEDVARIKYENAHAESVLEFGLLIHPQYHWLGASPDGVTMSGKVVEIKCPISRPIKEGHIPEHYYPQVQIVMEVCDLDEAVFIQYKPEEITWPHKEEFTVFHVPRDKEWFARALPQLESFFQEMLEAKEQAKHLQSLSPDANTTNDTVPKRKPRTKKSEVSVEPCMISEDLYQDYEHDVRKVNVYVPELTTDYMFLDDD